MCLVSCGPAESNRVDPANYDSFWLWAGVRPPAELDRARSVYVLDSELRARDGRFVPLRAGAPRSRKPELWLVVRTDTLAWPEGTVDGIAARAGKWAAAGNRVAGVQIDFDARTRGLGQYAHFLEQVRERLPRRYRLSITGLMDWSANGNPDDLRHLRGIVDEVVVQTYQGRTTIPGYDLYIARMKGFPIPFKIGLVQGGMWREPPGLRNEAMFRGYVVFLTNKQ